MSPSSRESLARHRANHLGCPILMNENDAYMFEIEEPAEWVFTGTPVWISGWFLSKNGSVFTDIRAMIDGVPHMGIWGLPREHVELRHRGNFGLPHAGFCFHVRPPAGAKLLRIELLDAGNHWVEIWRKKIKVKRGPRAHPRLRASYVPLLLNKLLQAHRADPTADHVFLAGHLALEASAKPLDSLPNPPFFGALENPLELGHSQYGKLKVEGWLIHLEKKIVRLTASTHPLIENAMDYGARVREDAARLFPSHPQAALSQFFGMIDIAEDAPDPVCLQIYAELEDGSRHLVFVRRFQHLTSNQYERHLPAFSRGVFIWSVKTLVSGCRLHRIRLGRIDRLWSAGWKAYRAFYRDAPRDLSHLARKALPPYNAWQQNNRLSPRLREIMTASAAREQSGGPRVTILVDTKGCTPGQLQELAASLVAQIYPQWNAWFVGRPAPMSSDLRVHHERCTGPKDLPRALNTAAHQSQGSHLALIPGHSRLPPDALLEIAERIIACPDLELVYTDEDLMNDEGVRTSPSFKAAWSPALATSGLFPGLLCVVRYDRFIALGSFRDEYPLVPWFDLLLRIGDHAREEQIAHVPLIGHHGRASVSRTTEPSHPSVEQARKALNEALQRRAWAASAFLPETGHHRHLLYHQLLWDPTILHRLQVTIVIPTRDKLHLLQECVELLEETVDWRYVKLIIVDDHSRDADAVRYLEAIQKRNDLMCMVVRPEDRAAPFNYSHLVNLALPHIDTPLVLHLNNDVNALERGWLEEMVGWFTLPEVGVVGAKLLYPQKTLNHTGIVIGPHGGLADTPYAGTHEKDVPDITWYSAARDVSAVTGACLMTRTSLYHQLGGFDEKDFGVSYNDVDYCLRVRAAGRRVIYTPQAKLMHWGSASRGVTFDEAEQIAFVRRYPLYRDPFLSSHLTLAGNQLESRGADFARAARGGEPRVLIITHNLNLEGAPLFMLEYAGYLAHEGGLAIEVLSASEGPLRASYERLGATITLINPHRMHSAHTEEEFAAHVADIGRQIDFARIDLVVCNTLACFWGVHLAAQAGKPSLFYIHESTSLFRFFEKSLRLHLHVLAVQALERATRTLFLCEATRAYYEDYNHRDNFRIVPSWIKLEAIEEQKRRHSRAELRRKHGFSEDQIVIANIGTVCERKGQHVFVRAVDHFNHHYHGTAEVRFVMVGARPGIYLDILNADISHLDLRNLSQVPETRDALEFFLLADLFVCSSYEESFPRVIMEAMAARTPIVTTDVHGVPEMVRQRAEAYLVKPGDAEGLSRMMKLCLAKEKSGKSLTPTAYSKVLRYYDYHKVLPFHVDLAREAVLVHE